MAILIRIFVLAVAACYSPEVRDCTVTCDTNADCAIGQRCGEDRFCAAPAVAGTCDVTPDASPPEAGPTIDASATSELRVTIIGKGKGTVVVVGHGTCASGEPQHGDCAYAVPLGIAVVLRAAPADEYALDTWSSACAGTDEATCTVIPTAAHTLAGVSFRKRRDAE